MSQHDAEYDLGLQSLAMMFFSKRLPKDSPVRARTVGARMGARFQCQFCTP